VTLAFLAAAAIEMADGLALAGCISSGMLRRGFAAKDEHFVIHARGW
jgi:hypothetical protein